MEQVVEFFSRLFEAESWPARWNCGTWSSFHGWFYIISDIAVWAAYFAIPVILFIFIQKRKNELPFVRLFWLFILFIVACGFSHLVDAMIFYYPAYRLSALVLFITAVVSWLTVIRMYKLMPMALSLKTPVQLEMLVDERTSQLKKASENLNHQNFRLRSFANITSHNLRAPVSNLIFLMQAHEKEEDQEEKDEIINKFRNVSKNLLKTIDELYEVVRIYDNEEITSELISLEEVLKKVKSSLSGLIEREGARVEYDFSKCPRVYFPSSYMESVFLNLLSNALKYRSPDRPLRVSFHSWQEDGDALISCTDNGRGMDLDRFGNQVFKLHRTFHENKDARGVGLFMIKNQIESLGGAIDVESTVRKGTTFTIRIKSAPDTGS